MVRNIFYCMMILVFFLIFKCFLFSEKINLLCIIKDYNKIFYNFNTGKKSIKDEIFFIVVPIILGIILGNFIFFTKEIITILLNVFSILLGLMLNLLVLTVNKTNKEKYEKKYERELKKQIFNGISFSIFISIFVVIFSLIASFDVEFIKEIKFYIVIKKIYGICMFSLILLFFMDLLMILKRIHSLFGDN